MDKRRDRGSAARLHIVGVATRLFADDGYEHVAIERVLRECGISRGALYHHFAGKEALFTAVVESVEMRVMAEVATTANGIDDARVALGAAARAWLALAATDRQVRRILLHDAPAALGWQAWRDLENRYALGLIKAGLARAADTGMLRGDQVELHAHLLLAAMTETALTLARADDPAAQMHLGLEAIDRLLDALVGPSSL